MGLLSKDAILASHDLATEDVEVPEWGGTVRLRLLTGTERARVEDDVLEARNKGKEVALFKLRVLALCLVDDAGNRLFTDAELGQLGKKSANVIESLFKRCQQANGLGGDAVEEEEKNSASGAT